MLWENRQNNPSIEGSCILQCGIPCPANDSIDKITLKNCENIKEQSKKCTGLDTFESVFTVVDWKFGPTGVFMYEICYIKCCSPSKLAQAE